MCACYTRFVSSAHTHTCGDPTIPEQHGGCREGTTVLGSISLCMVVTQALFTNIISVIKRPVTHKMSRRKQTKPQHVHSEYKKRVLFVSTNVLAMYWAYTSRMHALHYACAHEVCALRHIPYALRISLDRECYGQTLFFSFR